MCKGKDEVLRVGQRAVVMRLSFLEKLEEMGPYWVADRVAVQISTLRSTAQGMRETAVHERHDKESEFYGGTSAAGGLYKFC